MPPGRACGAAASYQLLTSFLPQFTPSFCLQTRDSLFCQFHTSIKVGFFVCLSMPNMTYLCKCIILGILKQKKSLYFYNNIFMYTHTKVRMKVTRHILYISSCFFYTQFSLNNTIYNPENISLYYFYCNKPLCSVYCIPHTSKGFLNISSFNPHTILKTVTLLWKHQSWR